jgi:hypothetical protein
MTQDTSQDFGELRALLDTPATDMNDIDRLWSLVRRVATSSPDAYREQWLPYIERHPNTPKRWGQVDSVADLVEARHIAPFATFSLSVEAYRAWRDDHEEAFEVLADFTNEPPEDSDDAFMAHLDEYFFGSARWREPEPVSMRYLGSCLDCYVTTWSPPHAHPHDEPLVAWVDSEGGMFLIATSLQHFLQQIAHAPFLYDNESRQEDVEESDRALLNTYRTAVTEAFGALPSYDELLDGLSEENERFLAWRERVSDFE